MTKRALPLLACAALLPLAACSGGDEAANQTNATAAQPGAAGEAAGNQTIAAGLDQNSRFFQAARSVGLDATLAGPGPYTVLVPADQAFAGSPAGQIENPADPAARAQVTGAITHLILPGTILAEDISGAIERGNGNATLATMGGGTISATRDGDAIVFTDGSGGTARVTQADQRFSNGVVHRIDGMLSPGDAAPSGETQSNSAEAQQPAG